MEAELEKKSTALQQCEKTLQAKELTYRERVRSLEDQASSLISDFVLLSIILLLCTFGPASPSLNSEITNGLIGDKTIFNKQFMDEENRMRVVSITSFYHNYSPRNGDNNDRANFIVPLDWIY